MRVDEAKHATVAAGVGRREPLLFICAKSYCCLPQLFPFKLTAAAGKFPYFVVEGEFTCPDGAVPKCTGVLCTSRQFETRHERKEFCDDGSFPHPNESVLCLSVAQASLPEEVARVVVACLGPSGRQAPSVMKSAEEMCKVSWWRARVGTLTYW